MCHPHSKRSVTSGKSMHMNNSCVYVLISYLARLRNFYSSRPATTSRLESKNNCVFLVHFKLALREIRYQVSSPRSPRHGTNTQWSPIELFARTPRRSNSHHWSRKHPMIETVHCKVVCSFQILDSRLHNCKCGVVKL
jgi:hypothetical protein